MSGEPIMPVHVRGGENVTSTHFTIEGPNECVLVFLTPASWRAMVERHAHTTLAAHWDSLDKDEQAFMRFEADRHLRAALNLPDGWTP